MKRVHTAPTTPHATTPAKADLEIHNQECVIDLGGDWQLHAPTPSWHEISQKITASKITITATELGLWDTALLLFLMHARVWCVAKKKNLELSSLPTNVARILARIEQAHAAAECYPYGAHKDHGTFDLRFFIGSKTLLLFKKIKEITEFLNNCTLGIVHIILGKQKLRWIDCLLAMQECWSSSLLIVSFISFLVGVILAFQAAIQFQRYGAGILVVDLVSLSIVREMGPIMAAIVVAGGTGAGFAAQLGNMKVDEEIDALQTLGISVVNFLVLPRLFAITIMMPILTIYSNVLGILGGMYISATMLHIPTALYWNEMYHRVSWIDISSGLIKSLFFGMMIALAGCLRGIHSERNTAGVGHATSSAVVTSIMLIILADALFSVIYNALGI